MSPLSGNARALRLLLYLPLPAVCLGLAVAVADILFFPETGRRLSYEVFALRSDPRAVWGMAWAYRGAGLAWLGCSASVAAAWVAWVRRVRPAGRAPLARGAALFLAWAAALGIGFRGGLQSKPLRPGHAFGTGSPAAGQLALNPVFTVYHALKSGQAPVVEFFPPAQALRTVRGLLETDPSVFRRADYPLLRASAGPPARGGSPNLVVLVLEGIPARYVGAMGGPAGLTPVLDRLAREGALFTEFYAVGHRSMDGIAAIGCSVPTFPDLRPIGGALEQNALRCLGRAFREAGYATLFLHGAKTGSMGLDAFSRKMGFERYLGREDFDLGPAGADPVWGVYDGPALLRLHQEIRAMPRPFLAFWFGLTSHSPYHLPSERFRVTPSTVPDHEFLDTIRYTDASLGEFLEQARRAPYFQDTVFVITSDHTAGTRLRGARERHRVPLILYAPGRIPSQVRGETGGHLDVLPTLLEIAGVRVQHHALGRSLARKGAGARAAFLELGSHYAWVRGERLVVAEAAAPLPQTGDALERELFSFLQVSRALMRDNRLAPAWP